MRISGACWSIAGVLFLVAGCGGGGGSGGAGAGGTGSGGTGGGTMLGCNPATYCGPDGFECGIHAVATCGEVDCGACRFVGAESSGFGDLTTAPDGTVHVVLSDGGRITYALAGDAGLTEEPVASDAASESAGIAVGDDGTIHIAYIAATQTMHASKHPGESTWTIDAAGDAGESVSIAVDAAGDAQIVVVGEDPVTRGMRLLHVTESGGSYRSETIDGVTPISTAPLARGADGSIALVTRSGLMDLAVFDLVDGRFVRDSPLPALDDQPAEWSIAVTADGKLEVLALLGNYTLISGSKLVLLTRSGGSWTVAPAGGSVRPTHGIALAAGPSDSLHMAYYAYNEDGFFYTRPSSPVRLTIDSDCDDGDVRVAVDPDDQPHILYRCNSSPTRYIAPVARFSDAYIAACNQGAKTICDRACACGSPDCCFGAAVGDSGSCYFGPGSAGHDLCVQEVYFELCGDMTADETGMLACQPELEANAEMCVDEHYPVPQLCLDLMNANL